jgi:uncharacterized protein YjeT (DUF2065 family)
LELFLSAVALLLIFEGLLPFLSPENYLRFLESMRELQPSQLRIFGGVMMFLGVILLYSVK